MSLRYVVLPNIDHYKPEVERLASYFVDRPVTINTIQASWHGLYPTLQLRDVVIHNHEGSPALILPEVDATLSWLSLLTGELRLHTLELNRPDLEIERDVEGKIFVAGIAIDTNKSDDGRGLDWLLSQRQIVIRGGWVRWRDLQRDAPELVLANVNLQIQNSWRSHRFALKAIPPVELAAPIDIRADFMHPAFVRKISDYTLWTGEIYVDWRNTSLQAWKKYFDYPYEIEGGNGSVRAWLDFDRGVIRNFTADLALTDIAARLGENLTPLKLVEVSGRISAGTVATDIKQKLFSYGDHGHVLKLTNFSLRTDLGTVLPSTTVSSVFTAASSGHPERHEIEVTELDLDTLAQLAQHLPMSSEERRILTEFVPHGRLQNFVINWDGARFGKSKYQIKGKFSDLALKAQQTRTTPGKNLALSLPSFEGFSGEVDANHEGGTVSLNGDNANISVEGLFDDPLLPFEKLDVRAAWSLRAHDRLSVQINSMQFTQGGVQGSLAGKYVRPLGLTSEKLGELDLKIQVPTIDLTQVARFLPKVTPLLTRQWMTDALLSGQAKNVELVIRGDLDKFPFETKKGDKPAGVFKITGDIENGKLIPGYEPTQYKRASLWPNIEEIQGSLVLDRTRLMIHANSAKTADLSLAAVDVVIPDYWAKNSVIEASGTANGSLQSMLVYTNASPVAGWIDGFTEEIKTTGNARINLKMQLPLGDSDEKMVKGSLRFMGNDVQLMRNFPMISQTNGELVFTENNFQTAGVQGNFLGGQMQLSGGMQRDGGMQFKIDGVMTSDGLARAYPMQVVQRLAKKITGGLRYNATLRLKNQRHELLLESSLAGLAIDLPAPLNKTASDSMPLRLLMVPVSLSDQSVQSEEMRISLGKSISARYLLQKPNAKSASWKMVRGGIGVNVPAPQPDKGLGINLNVPLFNIDAWRNTASMLLDESYAENTTKESGVADAYAYFMPDVFSVRTNELVIAEKSLTNAVISAAHTRANWLINIQSDQATGNITWDDPSSERGAGKITARLVTLIIPKSRTSDVTELFTGKTTTAQLPGLDLIAENVELMGIKLGRLEVNATNAGLSQGREWHISRLLVTNPDGVLRAAGKWSILDRDSQSTLNYELDITDAGRLLDRFGFERTVKGGKGSMQGELSWKGTPYAFDIPTLSGNLSLKIATGQFLKVEPGVSKLLGVMSLQALPRRLTLDFRDIFSEGFVFDGISGTGSIARGVIKTDSFKMRGTSSVVLMDGSVDLKDETQNLNVVVIPELNTGGASVVYALAVNPIIGLGSFLAQLFLRNPIAQALSQEYLITGPWKDPVIKKATTKRKVNVEPAEAAPHD